MYAVSIVIPFRDDHRIVRCVESFLAADGSKDAELLLMSAGTPPHVLRTLQQLLERNSNVRLHQSRLSRQERRDLGAELASAEQLCFIDSDCVFDQQYFTRLLPELGKHPIMRAPVIYLPRDSYFSRGSCTYREIADTILFRNESFSPNLIIRRDVLKSVGGWRNASKHAAFGDDFVLSDALRQGGYSVRHINGAIIYHADDESSRKTLKTWFGYGIAWAFRYYKNRRIEKTSFISYAPPFPYRLGYGVSYFFIAALQWSVISAGFLCGLFKFGVMHGQAS